MADILALIDAAVDNLCACGCGEPLRPDGPSQWYAYEDCQRIHMGRTATNPHEVYQRPDADMGHIASWDDPTWTETSDGWARLTAGLATGPPPRRPTPATDKAIEFYQAIGNINPHKFRWVMSPELAEQLDREQDRPPGDEPPDVDASTVITMFGMPIRLDEHATTIMLELR